jgi:hypothetical protein
VMSLVKQEVSLVRYGTGNQAGKQSRFFSAKRMFCHDRKVLCFAPSAKRPACSRKEVLTIVDHTVLQWFYLKTNIFTLTWWLYLQGCQSLLFAFNTTFHKSSVTQTISVFCQPGAQRVSSEFKSEWLLTVTAVTTAPVTCCAAVWCK